MAGRFEVDRAEGKLLGVCAGLANHTGVDATIIRVGLVLVTVMGAFPWTLIAYGIAAFVGQRARPPGACAQPGRRCARNRASGCATSTSGCRRSRPTSPARTAASPARSRSSARPERREGIEGGRMSEAMMTITMASFGLVALSIALFAGLKGWQGWLEVKRMELAGHGPPRAAQPGRRPDRDGGPQGTDPQARIDRRLHRPVGSVRLCRSSVSQRKPGSRKIHYPEVRFSLPWNDDQKSCDPPSAPAMRRLSVRRQARSARCRRNRHGPAAPAGSPPS